MQEAWEGGLDEIVVDPLGQALDAAEHRRGQAAVLVRLPCHEQKALIAEEGHPAARLWIGLSERSDQRVALIAEPLALGGVEVREQLARVAFDAWGNPAPIVFDEVHHEQAGLGIMDVGDGELRVARKLAKHVGLKLETGRAALAFLPRLHRQTPSIGELKLKPRESEPDGQGARLDHGRAEHSLKPRLKLAALHPAAVNRVRQCHKPATKSL